MPDRAARLARLGTRLVSALAGLLMLALLAFGGFALWQDAVLRRGAFVGAELLQYKPAAPAADNPTLAGLQTVNPDVCGWLTVDGTGIDYPVVQGATNMDYVNRDVYGDFSLSGAIFLDSRCAADLTDPYTVIYGHHMDNSAMFGDVARFAEADFFAAHPAGSISLPDAAYTIELFACVVTDAYDTAIYTPERYPDDVGALLDYAAAQAVQQRDIGVTAQDRLVALSTCGKTALRCWLPAAALLLALLCPLPVAAARAGTAIPVSVRTDGAAADAVYTVELTPLDAAPAPVQRALTVKNGGTVYFTGFVFDEPGDYRYLVAERSGGAAHTTYDAHSYTVTVRVTGRPDGGLAAGLWAVRSGETAKADGVLFVNRYDPPETAAAAVTASAARAGTRTVKAAAPAALPQTGDGFPIEALAAAFCASIIGFGTAWKRR